MDVISFIVWSSSLNFCQWCKSSWPLQVRKCPNVSHCKQYGHLTFSLPVWDFLWPMDSQSIWSFLDLLVYTVWTFLWNIVIPVLFNAPKLGFIQSWALLVIANLLFSNGTVQTAVVLLQTTQQDDEKELLKD